MKKDLGLRTNMALGVILAFLVNTFGPVPLAQADEFRLPAPGVRVHLSPEFNPPILKGIKVHPDNPFRFDFILDQGDSSVIPAQATAKAGQAGIQDQEQLKTEATRLIKYFLASLTIPEKDLWVNLSPYEKNRIIPESFGETEMGRDLLAEDYMLKQITASLIYPEDEIGKKFWKRIYEEATKKYGTTNIPVNTFNKVWIVPEKAVVYENAKAGTAYVVESKLKVMLEQDYLALEKNSVIASEAKQSFPTVIPGDSSVIPASAYGEISPIQSIGGKAGIQNKNDINALGSQIVREIVIPELTKEINEGKNFAQLRQVYNSLILAIWYKKKIKDSILAQVYADKNKTAGVQYTSTVIPAEAPPLDGAPPKAVAGIQFKNDVEGVYLEYLKAFKKGVYNYIKEEQDPMTQQIIPRKYFSGGMDLTDFAQLTLQITQKADFPRIDDSSRLLRISSDFAMQVPALSGQQVHARGTTAISLNHVFDLAFTEEVEPALYFNEYDTRRHNLKIFGEEHHYTVQSKIGEHDLSEAIAELIKNALDEPKGGQVRVQFFKNGTKAGIEISNDREIDYVTLRREAQKYAREGQLIHQGDMIIMREGSQEQGANRVSEDQVAGIPDQDLLWIYGLSRGKLMGEYGAYGVGMSKSRRIIEEAGAEMSIRSNHHRTTVTLSFDAAMNAANIWINDRKLQPDLYLTRKINEAEESLSREIKITPLVLLPYLSYLSKKQVYLKNEAEQITGSFKIRGVLFEVEAAVKARIKTITTNPKLAGEPFYIVTQTDGNHGLAMIRAVALIKRKYKKLYPGLSMSIDNIRPVVFTILRLPDIKKRLMEEEMANYNNEAGANAKGKLENGYPNYAAALKARQKFIADHDGNAAYMEHGGMDIMAGHATAGIEIAQQLKALGIGADKRVVVIIPVGAGGPVGIAAGVKLQRPHNTQVVIAQTKPYSAFVRSLKSGTIKRNENNPSPTAVIDGTPIVAEDGIAVDQPEPDALKEARRSVEAGVIVDDKESFNIADPLVYRDLEHVYGPGVPVVGGTTALTAQALLDYSGDGGIEAIRKADVVVLFGTEGNVEPKVTEYIKALAHNPRFLEQVSRNGADDSAMATSEQTSPALKRLALDYRDKKGYAGPMVLSRSDAILYFRSLMHKQRNIDNIASIIRINQKTGKVLVMSQTNSLGISHRGLIEEASWIWKGYFDRSFGGAKNREWISVYMSWENSKILKTLYLLPPTLQKPREMYSDPMLSFLGKKREEMPENYAKDENIRNLRDETIILGRMFAQAAIEEGIDPQGINVLTDIGYDLGENTSMINLDILAKSDLTNKELSFQQLAEPLTKAIDKANRPLRTMFVELGRGMFSNAWVAPVFEWFRETRAYSYLSGKAGEFEFDGQRFNVDYYFKGLQGPEGGRKRIYRVYKEDPSDSIIFTEADVKSMSEHGVADNVTREQVEKLFFPKRAADLAMGAKGGIDLTHANMKLQTQNAGEGIKFHLDPAQLTQLQNAPGFVPVIINIQPMTDLRQFLGVPSTVSTGKLVH